MCCCKSPAKIHAQSRKCHLNAAKTSWLKNKVCNLRQQPGRSCNESASQCIKSTLSGDRTVAKAVKPEEASHSASMKSRVAPKVLCRRRGDDGGDITSGSGDTCTRPWEPSSPWDLCLSMPAKLQSTNCSCFLCCHDDFLQDLCDMCSWQKPWQQAQLQSACFQPSSDDFRRLTCCDVQPRVRHR